MAAPVAVIVKKVATAILFSDKETKLKIGTVIATIIITPLIPTILVVMMFTSAFDTDAITTNANSRLVATVGQSLLVVDDNLASISSTMSESGYNEPSIEAAKSIYTLYFLNCGAQDNFVSRYVGCFSTEMNATTITSNLNSTFGTSVDSLKVAAIINSLSSTYIDPSRFLDISTKTNLDLVNWAHMAYENHWGYVWGTYGNVLTRVALESLSQTYPTQVGAEQFHDYIQSNYIGRHCVDCAGLIKSYMWYDFNTGKFVYGSNGCPDFNTERMFSAATVKGPINSIPEVPGIAVYHRGHVGVYIGDGWVIEAMGTRYGVRMTRIEEGSWTNWFYIPSLTYVNPQPEEEPASEENEATESSNTPEETGAIDVTESQETINSEEENTNG